MDIRMRNATVWTKPTGVAIALVSHEPPLASEAAAADGGGGLSTGAIAGIAVAVLVVFAAIGAGAATFVTKRRCRHRYFAALAAKQTAAEGEVSSSESSGSKLHQHLGAKGAPLSAACSSELEKYDSSAAGGIAIPPEQVSICKQPNGQPWLLGCGNFGRVYKGQWRGLHEVAVKQLNCIADDMLLASLEKEIGILKKVSFNRNVVQFYGFSLGSGVADEADGFQQGPMLVMEYMECGDLRRALWKQPAEHMWHGRGGIIALDIARGMHFLHSSGVIHRDIKTSNVLLTRDGTAKIADVGLAITADYFSAGSATGTFTHAAPELLMGGKCSPKVDVYSFGVVLWELVTGQHPVRGHLREVRADECPPVVEALLSDCISSDVDMRPTSAEIVERLSVILDQQTTQPPPEPLSRRLSCPYPEPPSDSSPQPADPKALTA